jgi:hypothetical protein
MIQGFCEQNGLKLVYYRKFKQGHIPMYREVKVRGPHAFPLMKQFLDKENFPVANYHREYNEAVQLYKNGKIDVKEFFNRIK